MEILKSVSQKARKAIRAFEKAAKEFGGSCYMDNEEYLKAFKRYKETKTDLFMLIGELERANCSDSKEAKRQRLAISRRVV